MLTCKKGSSMASYGVWVLILAASLHSLKVQASQLVLEQRLFESFVSNYSKSYKNDQDTWNQRFKVFQQSLARQKVLNDYESEHGGTAVYGINQFSDLTPQEFKALYLSPARRLPPGQSKYGGEKKSFGQDRFDWREKKVIGPIRNQQRCGSCWAFAVVETIESAYAIEQGTELNFTLSSQQVISCDKSSNLGLNGCKGGQLLHAFQSLQDMEMVIVAESVYPFLSSDGEDHTCETDLPKKGLKLTKFSFLNQATLDQMMSLLHDVSPLTTSVNAVAWQDYVGGIVQHHCTDSYVDHAVQVVGYDVTGDVPYWIVRNTWGDSWGEKGYIRLLHGANMCGIRDEVAAVNNVTGMGVV